MLFRFPVLPKLVWRINYINYMKAYFHRRHEFDSVCRLLVFMWINHIDGGKEDQ
jgi:hypothetical protein